MRSHGVGWDDPTTFPELMSNGEFIKTILVIRVDAEGDEWQRTTVAWRHDEKTEGFELLCKIVGGTCQVEHDGAVAMLAKSDHLVVLRNDVRCTFGEVQGEGSLISTEVVDVEDELLRKIFWRSPDHPTNAGVDHTIFVARDVDGNDLFELEVPLEVGVDEGSDEAT